MRRRLLLVAAVAVIGFAAVRLAVRPVHVSGYQQIDDYNIALEVIGASPTWRGVTEHAETPSEVVLGVSQISFQVGAGFGDERIAYVAIRLRDPLGERVVVDASTGTAITRLSR